MDVNQIQDLHGYGKPWVGGAGKNIIDVSDKTVTSQTTILYGKTFPAGTYTLSADTINNSDINCNIRVNKTGASTIIASILIPASASTKTRRDVTFTLTEETQISILCNGQSSGYNFTVQNVMLEKGSTATDFEPYSNICPISGWSSVNIHVADGETPHVIDNVTNISLGQTVYGGELDVTSGVIHPYKYYANYNGETLVGRWISSTDEYAEGATPTVGAQVVDFGAYDSDISLTPTQVSSILGVNNIWTDAGVVTECKYFKNIETSAPQIRMDNVPYAKGPTIDVLYNDSNGAAHSTWLDLAHSINDYDVIYIKISNPTDIREFNLYTHHSFMPIMYGGDSERVSIQALYGQRVVDIVFDGATFKIVRTDGDFLDNTIYEIVGIKY